MQVVRWSWHRCVVVLRTDAAALPVAGALVLAATVQLPAQMVEEAHAANDGTPSAALDRQAAGLGAALKHPDAAKSVVPSLLAAAVAASWRLYLTALTAWLAHCDPLMHESTAGAADQVPSCLHTLPDLYQQQWGLLLSMLLWAVRLAVCTRQLLAAASVRQEGDTSPLAFPAVDYSVAGTLPAASAPAVAYLQHVAVQAAAVHTAPGAKRAVHAPQVVAGAQAVIAAAMVAGGLATMQLV